MKSFSRNPRHSRSRRLVFEPLEHRALLATIPVTTTSDTIVHDDGVTSLREAILVANLTPEADEINVPAGYYRLRLEGSLEDGGGTGDLDITDDLRIVGAGAGVTVVDAGGIDRVFHVLAGSVEMSGLTITGGMFGEGGGINNQGNLTLAESIVSGNTSGAGGGIYNTGDLEFLGGRISGNHAPGEFGFGGGIYNFRGTVLLAGSTVSGNDARSGGGLVNLGRMEIVDSTIRDNEGRQFGLGGGIHNGEGARLFLTDSTVADNRAFDGGGIRNLGSMQIAGSTITGNEAQGGPGGGISLALNSSAVISSSTVSGNTTDQEGGGISNLGTLVFRDGTISGNQAGSFGGGIDTSGHSIVVNSTVSGNEAARDGGGIRNTGSLRLTSATIADNRAPAGIGGGIVNRLGTLDLTNTIVANNSASTAPDLGNEATLGAAHHNLIENPAGHAIVSGRNGNIVGVDPRLGPLAANGGPTPTHALLAGSRAIDAGTNAARLEPGSFDQRGARFPRVVDGNSDGIATIDIGSYESQSVRLLFDLSRRELGIFGSERTDRFTLSAALDGSLLVTHNGRPLIAMDAATNQPLQFRPNVGNTDSIVALLGEGDDVFEVLADRLELVGASGGGGGTGAPIEFLGEAGNDLLMLRAATDLTTPDSFPLGIRFDGGAGSSDAFHLLGTGVSEKVEAVLMQDFHDIAFGDASGGLQNLRALAFATERVVIDAAGGDNVVDVALSGPTGVSPLHADIRSGGGSDRISLDLGGGATQVSALVNTGSGDDVVIVEVDQPQQPPAMNRKINLGIDLGLDEDLFSLQTDGPPPQPQQPPQGPNTGLELRLDVRAGGGNDRLDIADAFGLILVWDVAIDQGSGDDDLDLTVTTPDRFRLNVLGGTGRDTVDLVVTTGPANNHLDVIANLGAHDDVLSFHGQPDDPLAQTGSLDARMIVIAGSGNDIVDLVAVPVPEVDQWGATVNLGTGHDEFGFDMTLPALMTPRSRVNFRLDVLGGAGNDVMDVASMIGATGADFVINLNGEGGADTTVVGIGAPADLPPPQAPPSRLKVVLDGGSGNDEQEVWCDLPQNFAIAGDIRVLGSAGNDSGGIFLDGNLSLISALIHGGLGKDDWETNSAKVRKVS
jgi:hypothetical protein